MLTVQRSGEASALLILLTLASAMALERLPLTRHVHKYLRPPSSRRVAVPLGLASVATSPTKVDIIPPVAVRVVAVQNVGLDSRIVLSHSRC